MDILTTPRGSLISWLEVTDRDISIHHGGPNRTIDRKIYDGTNSGEKFLSNSSQQRVEYAAHPEWPLVNTFPAHILTNPTCDISKEDFHTHCGAYTVLPDFWMHWAMQLRKSTSGGDLLKHAYPCPGLQKSISIYRKSLLTYTPRREFFASGSNFGSCTTYYSCSQVSAVAFQMVLVANEG